ncbi:MAG: TonB-dependent receptor plug domain-containing protein [Caulobacteraceae bacterium]
MTYYPTWSDDRGVVGERRARGRRSKALASASTAMLALAVAGGFGGLAQAQDQSSSGGDSTAVQEVVVTGSRIARRDFTSNSPIVTVNSQTFENRSSSLIEQSLNQLPQFQAGTFNAVTQAQQIQPSATGTPGSSELNLRGLGTNRNLVLLDGRRPQPADATLAVDINSIPSAAIDSVEVITGGASAVYGADAISGVVNFKLKHNFQGLEVDAQYGISEHGDDREPSVSALIGTNFADNRGNVMFGVDYTQRSQVLVVDRDFYLKGYLDPGTTAGETYPSLPFAGYDWGGNATFVSYHGAPLSPANAPSAAALNAVFGAGVYPLGGPVPGTNVNVNPDQSLFYPGTGANGEVAPGYTGPLNDRFKKGTNGQLGVNNLDAPLIVPLTRYSTFGNGEYKISDHVTAFVQGMFTQTQVTTGGLQAPATQFWAAPVPYDAAHPVPAQLATLLNSRPDPTAPWALELELDNVLGDRDTRDTTNTYQILAGFRGDVANTDLTYEVYGSHGVTSSVSDLYSGFGSEARWQALIALPNYGANGTLTSTYGAGSTGFSAHCTSGLYGAIFEGTKPSQDCIDALTIDMKSLTQLTQNVVEGDVQGGLFNLPAGQLRFALGADYREEVFNFEPDPLSSTTSVTDQPIGLFGNRPHPRLDRGGGNVRRAAGPGAEGPALRQGAELRPRRPLFGL